MLRHGQTNANLFNIIQGGGRTPNLPLNSVGVRQAELTARALAYASLDHIYTSPAMRTEQTAKKIFERNESLTATKIIPGLLEINFGILEGETFESAEKQYPELIQEYRARPSTCVFPKGESMAHALLRISQTVDSILINTATNENILIVSHGGVLALIFVYLFDLDIDKMFQAIRHDNCGLSIIEIDGNSWRKPTLRPQIIRMNDISHLSR